jgi:uncharacterized protein (TIGR02147 family)
METPREERPALDERPVITRFTDYRAYLRAMIAWLKVHRRGFSYRSFAMKAGFSSPSFLKLVADGQRNLSPDSIERVATGLGLDRREGEAFEALVELGQAESDARRNRAYTKIAKLAQRDPVKRLEADQFEAYSTWHTFVLRELAALPDFREDPDWLAQRLRFKVKPDEVRRALDNLERLGLLVRDEEGRLRPAERNLSSGPEVRTLAVRNFHRQMLEKASTSLDTVPMSERNITGVTVALSRRQYGRVIELIQQLRREVLAVGEDVDDSDEAPQIHQLTFALVPLTQEPK